MNDSTQIQYFLKTPHRTWGPFSTKAAAEVARSMQPITEQLQCTIEGKTADGKDILLG